MNITSSPTKSPNNETAGANMVFSQLRPNRVSDERILEIMGELRREMFVPPHMADVAYIDEDIKIIPGRHLMKPMIMARMLQAAEVTKADRVLDIAPAMGYSTAILAGLAGEVVALESISEIAEILSFNMTTLKISNVQVHSSPVVSGRAASAPYDVIFVNGSVEMVPEAILNQLAEGGRLITIFNVISGQTHVGEARAYRKIYGETQAISLFDANIRPLPEFSTNPGFQL